METEQKGAPMRPFLLSKTTASSVDNSYITQQHNLDATIIILILKRFHYLARNWL